MSICKLSVLRVNFHPRLILKEDNSEILQTGWVIRNAYLGTIGEDHRAIDQFDHRSSSASRINLRQVNALNRTRVVSLIQKEDYLDFMFLLRGSQGASFDKALVITGAIIACYIYATRQHVDISGQGLRHRDALLCLICRPWVTSCVYGIKSHIVSCNGVSCV